MFKAFLNAFKVKELRAKLLFTAGIIIMERITANIPCPGVDPKALANYLHKIGGDDVNNSFMGLMDIFSGGAIGKFAIGTLGIMPYISASIIMQLLVPVLPSLEKMVREGESGRQKIHQYTRYLCLVICLIQGAVAAMAMVNPSRLGLPTPDVSLTTHSGGLFICMSILILSCATMVLMWMGEKITEHGIGNGISILITVNIIARMPDALIQLFELVRTGGGIGSMNFKPVHLLILLMVFGLVTAFTIVLTQGQRRVPIQMIQKGYGNMHMQSGTTYLPLKVNFSGVMPIIFAGAIISVPEMVLRWMPYTFTRNLATYFSYGGMPYTVLYGLLIILFAFFWVANQFNPIQISDNLKKEGAFIPGIRPGQPTSDFLDSTMTKITLAGSLFLLALAIFPMFLYNSFKIPFMIASFFGGTSLLIMVGVTLDTLSQLESQLTMRNYEGFLKHGRLRSRRS